VIGAELFGDFEPAGDGIETDHAPRTARFCHRGAIQTK
jgi:hypothetical protein